MREGIPLELILSSGFLAFASHLGFLRAVEESTVSVSGLCGTSSGALIGALWLAGVKIKDIAEIVQEQAPYRWHRADEHVDVGQPPV